MSMESVLERLRAVDVEERLGEPGKPSDVEAVEEWKRGGVKFAASAGRLEDVYYQALRKLLDCIVPTWDRGPILHEGGVYRGCWLESTGTINAELLSRFLPSVSGRTYEAFADGQREDGLIPYKITEAGPVFRQIQLVTPLARSVWNHYLLNGRNADFLRKMMTALARFDQWLADWRNTRGSGCVEAFCAFDTGHDLSPRFWHIPDTPHQGDPKQYDPASPLLPLLAPDMTAHTYCQRLYLARMAEELGDSEQAERWRAKAKETLDSLFRHCYDGGDQFFYDVDQSGAFIRVQSDVLLRVLACEVGDDAFFQEALKGYLLNTRKFFAKYPFTAVAMDDPRFDPFSSYNSWAGPSNFLAIIRAPHAFEHHGRYVELTWVLQPIVSAMARMERFPQVLSPWTGAEGYTEAYSPAILGVLDFVERLCGIVPRPEGTLWFNGVLPYPLDHGEEVAGETGYSRTVDGAVFELAVTREGALVCRNGRELIRFPFGIRVVTDRSGELVEVAGLLHAPVSGEVVYQGRRFPVSAGPNEVLAFKEGRFISVRSPGAVAPVF